MTQAQFQQALLQLVKDGSPESRLILLKHFADPANIEHFACIFPDYLTKYSPPFHKEILHLYTQETGFKGVAAPRGFAKSTITDLVYLAWCALNGKKHFIILISDTFTQASMFLDGFKTEVETNELLKWLYPNAIGEIWSSNDLILYGIDYKTGIKSACRILPKGAGMKVRGLKFRNWRPDLFIIDDLENDELVESAERRDKLRKWLLRAAIPALAKDGEICYIGTILHFDSLLQNIMKKTTDFAAWKTLFFRAIMDGKSLWPEHFTTEELIRMRDDPTYEKYVGPLTFSQEMQNEPIDDNVRTIKPDWLNVRFKLADEQNAWRMANQDKLSHSDWVKDTFKKIIAGVDPAISEETTADYFAMITIGIRRTDGHIFILDYFRERIGDPLEQVRVILESYKTWHHDSVKVETVAYQKGLHQLVRRVGAEQNIYVPLSEWKPDKDKVRRAIIHSANFAGNLVHLREDHPLFSNFYGECIEFPLGRNDDMLDAYMNAAEETVIRPRARAFGIKASAF